MFGFKTEEEKFKLADYDRMKKKIGNNSTKSF